MRTVRSRDLPQLPAPDTLTRQDRVYRTLREAITAGRMALGDQVPSSRELAGRWQLSRGTVEQAYQRLTIEGYLERRRGAGTFVAASLPEHFLLPESPCRVAAPSQPATASPALPPHESGMPFCHQAEAGQPFTARTADPRLLDLNLWRRHLVAATRRIHAEDMLMMNSAGLGALRRAIAGYVKAVRGIDCDEQSVVITTGIRQSLGLIAGLLDPARPVGFEDPGYLQARAIFEAQRLTVRSVAVDAEGLTLPAAEAAHWGALYATPAHQSPLGVTMSATRRAALLDWAETNGSWIIEDDYDSEYNYLKAPPPALKSSDRNGQVLFCGSFNKVLYSSLRIGYLIVPPAWRDAIAGRLRIAGAHPGLIEQQALASMIDSGDIYAHVRQSRRVYQRRRDLVLDTLARRLGPLRVGGDHCGFHFVLWLPDGTDDRALASALTAEGLPVRALAQYALDHRCAPALLLSFAAADDPALVAAADRLGTRIAAITAHR